MITAAEISTLADAAILHLAADPELLAALLATSGLRPQDLRGAASRPDFAAALLDFMCESDERLLAFAGTAGMRPERIAHARAALEAGAVDFGRR